MIFGDFFGQVLRFNSPREFQKVGNISSTHLKTTNVQKCVELHNFILYIKKPQTLTSPKKKPPTLTKSKKQIKLSEKAA